MLTCEINVLKLLVFGGFPGKDLLPIYVPFSSCEIEGFLPLDAILWAASSQNPFQWKFRGIKDAKCP